MIKIDYSDPIMPKVFQEAPNTWSVRLDGGLRVDTPFGLMRAVQKIPFDARRVGGSYEVVEEFTAGVLRWARIRHNRSLL